MTAPLTKGAIATYAIGTLGRLARRARERFIAGTTRTKITHTERYYAALLSVHTRSEEPVSDSTRLAWLEWNEEAQDLLEDGASSPDTVLEWLELFPKLVLELYLAPETPKNARKLA